MIVFPTEFFAPSAVVTLQCDQHPVALGVSDSVTFANQALRERFERRQQWSFVQHPIGRTILKLHKLGYIIRSACFHDRAETRLPPTTEGLTKYHRTNRTPVGVEISGFNPDDDLRWWAERIQE